MGQPILGGAGEEISDMMAAATAGVQGWKGNPVFTVKETKGVRVFNYDGAVAPHFGCRGQEEEDVSAAMMRRESRGLVVGPMGVVARPMHNFFEEGQTADFRSEQVSAMVVQDARKKLDGMMVYGVVRPTDGWAELWTRAGPTGPSTWATRLAESGIAGDVLGLVVGLSGQGYTACFEWIGRQVKIKEKHGDSELVITQARHKVSGEYLRWEAMQQWATQYGVRCVEQAPEFVGMTVQEVTTRVQQMQGVEGFVVQLQDGSLMKVKTRWWHARKAHKDIRWYDEDQRQQEAEWKQWKLRLMQVQGCRAVLHGWPEKASAALVLDEVKSAVKVEEFIARRSGRRGAIVLSFRSPEEKDAAIGEAWQAGLELGIAYSSRSNGNAWHRIRTYWDIGNNRRGG